MSQSEITLITREGCTYCTRAKKLLEQEGVAYEERHLGLDISRDNVKALYPDQKVLPVVLLDGELLGGFNELDKWLFPPLDRSDDPQDDDDLQGDDE